MQCNILILTCVFLNFVRNNKACNSTLKYNYKIEHAKTITPPRINTLKFLNQQFIMILSMPSTLTSCHVLVLGQL